MPPTEAIDGPASRYANTPAGIGEAQLDETHRQDRLHAVIGWSPICRNSGSGPVACTVCPAAPGHRVFRAARASDPGRELLFLPRSREAEGGAPARFARRPAQGE